MTATLRPHALYWPAMHAADAAFDLACRAGALIRQTWKPATVLFFATVMLMLISQAYTLAAWDKRNAFAQAIGDLEAGRWEIQK